MNDTPGWASPGSARPDEPNAAVPRPAEPADDKSGSTKWSSNQPPPSQWSAPSGQYGPPPPPGPGRGGRAHSGWGPPQAAKPGVIPLRPLGVGEILDGAVSTLRTHWRTVLGITLTVSVVTQLVSLLIDRFLLPAPVEIDPKADAAEAIRQFTEALQSGFLRLGPTTLITLIATLFTTALLTVVISRSVLGRPVTLKEAWREARPRFPQLLGLTLLLPLIAMAVMGVAILPGVIVGGRGGIGLIALGSLVALPVVVWLMIRFALASPALMLERQGIIASLRRSAKLVQDAWWRTFGIVVLTQVLIILVTMIVAVPFTLIAVLADGSSMTDLMAGRTPDGWMFAIVMGIGAVVSSAVTYPVSAGVNVLLYIDQRIRREALDLELARAAGVPGYENEPPGGGQGS
ncbi:hypothetical protein [Streptomyces sp. CAU 1734]|uniref:glycerophosphoryl diester phosphodiesterase membrane domain-containing protein n=1 Tax=Streptomyces sp. CAU 1734 TaxID=3140360 RepID=UPI0032607E91